MDKEEGKEENGEEGEVEEEKGEEEEEKGREGGGERRRRGRRGGKRKQRRGCKGKKSKQMPKKGLRYGKTTSRGKNEKGKKKDIDSERKSGIGTD